MTPTMTVGSIATFGKGSSLAKSDLGAEGAHPCIHYGELFTQYGAVIDTIQSRTNRDIPTKSTTGDVLMPTSDVTPRGLAKASAVLRSGVGLGGDILIIRTDHEKVDPRFLAYAIRHDVNQVLGLVRGSTVYHLYAADMRHFRVPVLPLAEQARAADALESADNLIAALELTITKKQAIKLGMMQQLLTGKTRLPGFTDPWRKTTLGEVAQFSKGMGLPKSALVAGGRESCVHYGELFTHYGAEIRSITSRTNATSLRVRSVKNDVLMPTSDVTPRGLAKASALMADGVALGGDILVIRSDRDQVYGPFLSHAIRLDAKQVLQLVRGSTVYHLYATDMATFQLSLPTIDEQRAICVALRDIEHEIESLDGRLAKARAIKTGMMQELLTGRIRLPLEEVAT